MTTAYDIIHGALRKIGAIAVGETLAPEDSTTGLEQLNALLDMWSTEHLAVFNNNEYVLTLQAGKSTYTVGAGGDFNIARPLRLSGAYTRLQPTGSTVDYPCAEVDFSRYARIGIKNQPGPWPKVMYFNTSYPLAELIFWPVPSQNAEFHLWADMVFSQFANLTDTVTLPQGYMIALQANLALMLAPEYGVQPSPELMQLARSSKKVLKALNATPTATSTYDASLVAGNANDAGWILTGGF
jgi:hypothetical protein